MMLKRYEITLKGNGNTQAFLMKLTSKGVKVHSLVNTSKEIRFQTDQAGIKEIRKNRRKYNLKVIITPTNKEHQPISMFYSYRFILALVIPCIASIFLWTVTVESELPEMIEKMENILTESKITPLRPLFLIPKEDEIRRTIMQEDPSLSWVRFKRSGSTLTVIPLRSPKLTPPIDQEKAPGNLVAKTGGVITNFALERGERVREVHATVRKGEVLATGILEQGNKTVVVGAKGAVYADYWLEYTFSMPKTIQFHVQGEEKVSLSFSWPWENKNEMNVNPQFRIPLISHFVKMDRQIENVAAELVLKEGMEESVISPLLKNKLLAEPYSRKIIKDEKVLHVTYDNDTVSGTVLFLVNDNIAINKPYSQGD